LSLSAGLCQARPARNPGWPLHPAHPEPVPWQTIVTRITADAYPSGFDLVGATRLDRYQTTAPSGFHLPRLRADDDLVVLLGNTRALWPHFVGALRDAPERCEQDHPFDRWVQDRVETLVAALPWHGVVRFAHEAPPRAIAIQQLAARSGLAHLGPAGLSVHPVYGPWISWRAAIVFGAVGPEDDSEAPDTCTGCDAPCVPKLQAAMSASVDPNVDSLGADWRPWLAVRDACPIGRDARFPETQIRYHYAKDRETLRRLTEEAPERAQD
jgi:methylmalonic aciduria homocystinuria type C protein